MRLADPQIDTALDTRLGDIDTLRRRRRSAQEVAPAQVESFVRDIALGGLARSIRLGLFHDNAVIYK